MNRRPLARMMPMYRQPRAFAQTQAFVRNLTDGATLPKPNVRVVNSIEAQVTEVYLEGEIGGYWDGVFAEQFNRELRAITTPQITLHLNSPGGNVFEAVSMYNALRNHPAEITVHIDAIAASAGSFLAQAGDVVVIEKTATMMIHDALNIVFGNAEELREAAEVLDLISDNIAGIYSDRAGGDVLSWRGTMREEKWYSAQDAVDAGLADEIYEPPSRAGVTDSVTPPSPRPTLRNAAATSTIDPNPPSNVEAELDVVGIRNMLKEMFL